MRFAKDDGSTFNGVLCGRATWTDGAAVFIQEGEAAAIEWLRTQGKQNVDELNAVLAETAIPVTV